MTIVLLVIAATTVAGGQNFAVADGIDDQIKALTTALEKLSSVEGSTSDLIAKLRGEIDKIACNKADCKLALLDAFAKAIKDDIVDADKLTPGQVADPVLAILPPLAKLGGVYRPDLTAAKLAEALNAALENAKPQQPGSVDDGSIKTAVAILERWRTGDNLATSRAAGLRALLTSADKPKNAIPLADELPKLTDAITTFEDPNQSAKHRASELNTLMGLGDKVPDKAAFDADLKTLAAAISDHLETGAAAAAWAQKLTELLPKIPKAKRTPELMDALTKLTTVMQSLDERKGANFNILEAWYGDFHFIRKAVNRRLRVDRDTGAGRRLCDATTAVRTVCQGKKDCAFAATSAANQVGLTGDLLCGEDPVPHASASLAGIVVKYQCLSRTPAEWTELLHNSRDPSGDERVRWASLRTGTVTTLHCRADASDN